MQQYLIVRGEDFVHFGLQWSGFQLVYKENDSGSRPLLVATSDEARITLTFPPQVIEEQVWPRGSWDVGAGTSIPDVQSGPSHIQFAVPAETQLELNAEGILKVITDEKVKVISKRDEEATAIELPWKLILAPVPKTEGEIVVSEHPVLPVKSSKGVTGQWYTRLMASNGTKEDAALSLLPLRYIEGDMQHTPTIGTTPLTQSDRMKIVEKSKTLPLPYSKRLELTALGGTLSATVKWPNFEWDHEIVQGKDQKVRTLMTGVLFPFGHKARVEEITERVFINNDENTSQYTDVGLIKNTTLMITEPVIQTSEDPRLAREFPFDKIEILLSSCEIDFRGDLFIPHVGGKPLQFPIRLTGANGDVFFNVPLVFIDGDISSRFEEAKQKWDAYRTINLPGVPIEMIRDNRRAENVQDIYEVHDLSLQVEQHAGNLLPKLEQFTVELPALRELQPHIPTGRIPLKFTQSYLNLGVEEDLALEPFNKIEIDFTARPDYSGGLMAPKFAANIISRTRGPVPTNDLPLSEIYAGAKLLGLPLEKLIEQAKPPKIIQVPGNPLGARMEWLDLSLKDFGPFETVKEPDKKTSATLRVDRSEIFCEVRNFTFKLPLNIVLLKFGSLAFTQKPNSAPDLQMKNLGIEFNEELILLKDLLDKMMELMPGNKPKIHPSAEGISASYTLGLPSVDAGMFLLRNVAVHFGINVPFSSKPVTMSLGFGRRDNPFNLSVMLLGGGGHIEVEFGGDKLTRLEASMEFGAMVAVNFLIASAEVHALGGVRFLKNGDNIEFDAFIRIGGSVDVLGLVSVSVELTVKLAYEKKRNSLYGRATLVIEVDLPLFSESVTLDSGKWELIGSDSRDKRSMLPLSSEEIDTRLSSFMNYYKAFEQV